MKYRRAVILSIFLIAINLRLPITAIPPILGQLEKSTGLPASLAGMMTTIPLLTFAVLSPMLAKLGRKVDNERVILIFFALLVLGSFLRLFSSITTLLLGTLLIGLGIDSANVLLPAVIKSHLKDHSALGMIAYTSPMILMGAVGTASSAILVAQTSLRTTMMILFGLAIISLIGWLPMTHRLRQIDVPEIKQPAKEQLQASQTSVSVWRSKIGWLITIFFGLQALIYYSLITWLPDIFATQGYSVVTAGSLVTALQIGLLPPTFLTSIISLYRNGVKYLTYTIGILATISVSILALRLHSVGVIGIAMFVLGFSMGSAFNLSIVFFAEKATNPYLTAELSGMAQTLGNLLAATGPIVFGMLHTAILNWQPMLTMMIIFALLLLVTGVLIVRSPKLQA